MARPRKPKDPWLEFEKEQRDFLYTLAIEGHMNKACDRLKIPYTRALAWRRHDPKFKLACEDAKGVRSFVFGESLETEAMRLAKDGWEEAVYQGGKSVGAKQVFSPTLIMFMLKAHNPDKYQFAEKAIAAGSTGDVASNLKAALDEMNKVSGGSESTAKKKNRKRIPR